MNEEQGFLQKLFETPADDSTRLVYADWLEEQGDPRSVARAEYLRLTVSSADGKKKAKVTKRLQRLTEQIDSDWLATVGKFPIENCAAKRAEAAFIARRRMLFSFLCDRRWEELTATDEATVRYCEGCKQNVFYCSTIREAQGRAENQECVAVSLGVIRRKGDLEALPILLGAVPPNFLEELQDPRWRRDEDLAQQIEREMREEEEGRK